MISTLPSCSKNWIFEKLRVKLIYVNQMLWPYRYMQKIQSERNFSSKMNPRMLFKRVSARYRGIGSSDSPAPSKHLSYYEFRSFLLISNIIDLSFSLFSNIQCTVTSNSLALVQTYFYCPEEDHS